MTDKTFPALGQVYNADYGDLTFRVAFATDRKTLRWAPFATDFDAEATTETYQATFISPACSW